MSRKEGPKDPEFPREAARESDSVHHRLPLSYGSSKYVIRHKGMAQKPGTGANEPHVVGCLKADSVFDHEFFMRW